MKYARRRRFVPRAVELEPRQLLSNVYVGTNYTLTWDGQANGKDLTGPTVAVGPEG